MNWITRVTVSTVLFFSAFHSTAQEKLKEGRITFEIEIKNAEEMNDQMLAMMPKEMTVYFKDGKSRGEMSMMGGTIITITDGKSGETVSCMDIMGRKTAIKLTKDDAEKEREKSNGDYDVTLSDETKMIAGYLCKKATITKKGSEDKEGALEIWYTNELEAVNSTKYAWKGIDGYMMEFSVDQRSMAMKFTCTDVKKAPVSDDMFVVPEGFTVLTAEEAMKQFGGGAH